MKTAVSLKKGILKIFIWTLLSLFLVPSLTWIFSEYATSKQDALHQTNSLQSIERSSYLTSEQKQQTKDFVRSHPLSDVCKDKSEEIAQYRESICPRYSTPWQFHMAKKVSFWTLIGGAGLLLTTLVLGILAFVNRRIQLVSFMVGWRLIIFAIVIQIILQGAMLVWLSFWITAFFFHRYYEKLIGLTAILVVGTIFYSIYYLFKRPKNDFNVEGEKLSENDAPLLWANVRHFAKRLETAPPEHIVVGIDTNFFVSETPTLVGNQMLKGRLLFLSLPLLRVLDHTEANAVLAHELAHFEGGDTANNASLSSRLIQYDYYCQMMQNDAKGLGFALFLLRFYRIIFEIALKRESRRREFLADQRAASLVSSKAVVQSLIKIEAYASYRSEIESGLFEKNIQHDKNLGIAERIAAGLVPYAASLKFLDAMKTASVPHPFDSHPDLSDRMKNVNYSVEEKDFGRIVTSPQEQNWMRYIPTAAEIEKRLWSSYEEDFNKAHEESLAYRYRPANEAEKALVLKFFPDQHFVLRNGKTLAITYAGLILPGENELISWDEISNVVLANGYLGAKLTITHPEKNKKGKKNTHVRLRGFQKDSGTYMSRLNHYWHRHQIMRRNLEEAKEEV